MRWISISVTLVVGVVLYALAFERDRLDVFTGRAAHTPNTAQAPSAVSASSQSTAQTNPVISVISKRINAETIDNFLVLQGRTEAIRKVSVRAESSGLVVNDPLRKGAFVQTGDVLCKIEAGTRFTTLTEAEARLAEAQINAENARKLASDGFASETRKISAEAALRTAETAVQNAKRDIEKLNVVSPIAGILESDTAETGSFLQPGAMCAHIIQLDVIKFVGFVAEANIGKVKLGAPAKIRLLALPNVPDFTGTVRFIASTADPSTRTLQVEITAENPDLLVRDGMTAEITIASLGQKAHFLPQSALTLNDDGQIGVQTIMDNNNTTRFMPVTILRDTRSGVWVDGLPDTVHIVVVGQEFVTDGAQIKPNDEL